jgi:hypothetical protein
VSWWQGDFNYDGTVNINDFNMLASSFGQSVPSTQPPGALFITGDASATVPLPPAVFTGAAGLFLAGAIAHRARQRERIC